jgi:hypothetical protein
MRPDLRRRGALAAIAHRERPLPMHVLGLPRRQLSPDIDPLEMIDLAQYAVDCSERTGGIDGDLEHGLASCGNLIHPKPVHRHRIDSSASARKPRIGSRGAGLARLCTHSDLRKGNFNFAACAARCVGEINSAPKLVRDQIAYQAGAIAG